MTTFFVKVKNGKSKKYEEFLNRQGIIYSVSSQLFDTLYSIKVDKEQELMLKLSTVNCSIVKF